MEAIGILACFVGVILIGLAEGKRPEDVDEIPESNVELFGGNEAALRMVGILIMLFVAFNDASLNVMARTMKDVHYSLM